MPDVAALVEGVVNEMKGGVSKMDGYTGNAGYTGNTNTKAIAVKKNVTPQAKKWGGGPYGGVVWAACRCAFEVRVCDGLDG